MTIEGPDIYSNMRAIFSALFPTLSVSIVRTFSHRSLPRQPNQHELTFSLTVIRNVYSEKTKENARSLAPVAMATTDGNLLVRHLDLAPRQQFENTCVGGNEITQ